jgi:hypothetical protein
MSIQFSNLNLQIQVKEFLIELQTLPYELSWSLGANINLLSMFHPNLKILRRNSSKFYWISNVEASQNFHSKSTLNLKKFPWRKLFLSSNPTNHILFQFFWARKVLFGSVKIWRNLNFIWIYLNLNFLIQSSPPSGTVAWGPFVSYPGPPLFGRQRTAADSGLLPTAYCHLSPTPTPCRRVAPLTACPPPLPPPTVSL